MKFAQYGLAAAFALFDFVIGTPSQAQTQTHGFTIYSVKQYITQTSIGGGGYTIAAGVVGGECGGHAYGGSGRTSTGEACAKFATTVTWPYATQETIPASMTMDGTQSGGYNNSGSAVSSVDWSEGHLTYSTAVNGNNYNTTTSNVSDPAWAGTEIYFTLDAYATSSYSFASADSNYHFTASK